MSSNKSMKNVEKRVKEIAKDYESRGFKVSIYPKQSELPDFLENFNPDIIARKEEESVVVEVKTSSEKSDFKKYELLADKISQNKNWRFEFVLTNPIEPTINIGLRDELSLEQINRRINEIKVMLNQGHIEGSFLLGWATLEGVIRNKLHNENVNVFEKTTGSIIKTVYSLGLVNQHDYRSLETLNSRRNYLIHGFDSSVNNIEVDRLLNIILFLIGDSKEAFMYEWLELLDLEKYVDIYDLYTTVKNKYGVGGFTYNDADDIQIGSLNKNKLLTLANENDRQLFLVLIKREYMDDMSPEEWFSFKQSLKN